MIDNFHVIDSFLQFEEGTFYKFELLVRNTDGENELFPERCSNTNRNILIKSWYVDTKDYYEKIKHEMVTLSNITGARLYVTLDRKDNRKLVQSIAKRFFDLSMNMMNGSEPAIKGISKTFASETSKVENSCKDKRTIMFDIDTKEGIVVEAVICYIRNKGEFPYILDTKKGYHVFCYKRFDSSYWEQDVVQAFIDVYTEQRVEDIEGLVHLVKENVSMKPNELGLVYHPEKTDLHGDLEQVERGKWTMKKGMELPNWNGKFPKRYGCQYPYSKCESCYHAKSCVPDYGDELRKEFEEFTVADKVALAMWLALIVGAAIWLYFIKF